VVRGAASSRGTGQEGDISVDRQSSEVATSLWSRLRVPASQVAADIVDGEVVVINLDTGSYYSSEGVGCDVWSLLAAGRSRADVVGWLQARYEDEEGLIEPYVDEFGAMLLSEGLMVPAVADDVPDAGGDDARPPADTRTPFAPADFVGYDDMKGLLLLDPVHDVDEVGWPHAATGR
jgi:hypothetical protein